jgi:hypothetical protein
MEFKYEFNKEFFENDGFPITTRSYYGEKNIRDQIKESEEFLDFIPDDKKHLAINIHKNIEKLKERLEYYLTLPLRKG